MRTPKSPRHQERTMPRTTTETTVDPDGTERHPSFGTSP